jgi:hypothetical protein
MMIADKMKPIKAKIPWRPISWEGKGGVYRSPAMPMRDFPFAMRNPPVHPAFVNRLETAGSRLAVAMRVRGRTGQHIELSFDGINPMLAEDTGTVASANR